MIILDGNSQIGFNKVVVMEALKTITRAQRRARTNTLLASYRRASECDPPQY